MKWKATIGVLIALSVFSCNHQDENLPEVLLSERQMIDIMTDVQIIEADINSRKAKGENIGSDPVELYDQLFEHYGITDSIFNQSMRYYTYNPKVLEDIMDSVTNRLLKAQQD